MIRLIIFFLLLLQLIACDNGTSYKADRSMEAIKNEKTSDSIHKEFEKSIDTITVMQVIEGDSTVSYELKK